MMPNKTIHHKLLIFSALMGVSFFMPQTAEAYERCKTYSKTIWIDGQRETGYGKACEQHDGAWKIVKVSGSPEARYVMRERIYDDLYDRGFQLVVVNNYSSPRRYYAPPYYYKASYKYDHRDWKKYDDDWKGRGHDNHKGRGKGHKKHH